jgi:geranylgeranyl diphosphate synthase type II
MSDRTAPAGCLSAYIAARSPLIEAALDAAIPPEGVEPGPLHAAMRYSLFAGGKRIRPILLLAAAEAAGATPEAVMPAACAVELIHTYSLIHDDLPSMDDSATRRGRPSCHVAFGEALAVLAGDALHALAFGLIARTAQTAGPDRALRVVEEIAVAIGTQGMVGGQVLDLLAEDREALRHLGRWPQDRRSGVYCIHRWKTGALIRACVRAGAILAGASDTVLQAFGTYGEHLGLAFQIIDDVLDEIGDIEALGKDARHDAAASKLTFPSAYGIAESRRIAAEQTDYALAALAPLGPEADILREIAHALLTRQS